MQMNNTRRWICIYIYIYIKKTTPLLCATLTSVCVFALVDFVSLQLKQHWLYGEACVSLNEPFMFLRNLFFPPFGACYEKIAHQREQSCRRLLASATPSWTMEPLWFVCLWWNIRLWFCGALVCHFQFFFFQDDLKNSDYFRGGKLVHISVICPLFLCMPSVCASPQRHVFLCECSICAPVPCCLTSRFGLISHLESSKWAGLTVD